MKPSGNFLSQTEKSNMPVATVIDHLNSFPQTLKFVKVDALSSSRQKVFHMLPEYGSGSVRGIIVQANALFVVIADYTPIHGIEKTNQVTEEYIEISHFETDSNAFRIGGQALQAVDKGLFCYVNRQKENCIYGEAGKPVRFTKIYLTKKYFDDYFSARYGKDYSSYCQSEAYLLRHRDLPELNFLFRQIRDCRMQGESLYLYLESKVMELLSLIGTALEEQKTVTPVKLSRRDIRRLEETVAHMKKHPAASPSGKILASMAFMSQARYYAAFKQYFGMSPYEYLKTLRLNLALILLKNTEEKITTVAARCGYGNSGHFARLFRETYGITPREYRTLHRDALPEKSMKSRRII